MKLSVTGKSLMVEGVRSPNHKAVLRSLGGKEIVPDTFTLPRVYASAAQVRRRFPDIEESPDVGALMWRRDGHPIADPRLFDYQNNGVDFLRSRDGILSFSPGLGKTATAILAADAVGAKRILVVTMLTLIPTWRREIQNWSTGDKSTQEVRAVRQMSESRWCITNYDFLVRNVKAFSLKWDVLIVDESIAIKNRDTKRFKALKEIRSKSKRVWLLSGAPITRDTSDLWSQLNLIDSRGFPSFWRFVSEYCTLEETPWGTVVTGSNPMIDPRCDFSDLVLAVNKEEAGLNLPDLMYETIWVQMTPEQQRVYDRAKNEFILELKSRELPITTKLTQIMRLCQITSSLATVSSSGDSAKLDALKEMIENRVLETPCIIWTRFVSSAYLIADALTAENCEVEMILGETDPRSRDAILERFASGGLDFLVMGTAVGKYGLTLTSARSMVYFDLTYAFDDVYQSVHRVHRIGLDHSPTVFKLITVDSIEETILVNLSGKAENLARLTNDQILTELLS